MLIQCWWQGDQDGGSLEVYLILPPSICMLVVCCSAIAHEIEFSALWLLPSGQSRTKHQKTCGQIVSERCLENSLSHSTVKMGDTMEPY